LVKRGKYNNIPNPDEVLREEIEVTCI